MTDCCAAALLTLLCYRVRLLSVHVCTSDGCRKNTGLRLLYSSWICRIAVVRNRVVYSPTSELQMVDPECDYLLTMLLFT